MSRVIIPVTAKRGKIGYYGFYDKYTGELLSSMFYKVSEKVERIAEAKKIGALLGTIVKARRL